MVWTCLTLPNLGFWWVFFKYPEISNIGNLIFFPVTVEPLYNLAPWGQKKVAIVKRWPLHFLSTGMKKSGH